jgi:hypothetical protein
MILFSQLIFYFNGIALRICLVRGRIYRIINSDS